MERDHPIPHAATESPPTFEGPSVVAGHPVWSACRGPVEVRFVGRGADPDGGSAPPRRELLAAVTGRDLPVAELRQVHSADVLVASVGLVGNGDALWSGRSGLALSVVTADCVPVVLAARGPSGAWRIAVAHAGWRGIVAGVVPRTIAALGVPPPRLSTWIGPAIGACCYEVDDGVARQVAAATSAACVLPPGSRELPGFRDKPHLDLAAAVRHQLTVAGAPAPRIVLRCTRCDDRTLWSYRREGKGAGRNHAFVWLEGGSEEQPGERPCA